MSLDAPSLAEPPVLTPTSVDLAFDAGIVACAFSDSGLLAAGLGDGTVRLVDRTGEVRSVQAHDGAVLCLALDIDGRSFVTGGDDGRLVRSSDRTEAEELLQARGRQIDVVSVSRAAKARAVGVGREVRLLGDDGAVRGQASDHPSTVSGLAFNARGKRLAVAHYGGVTLWWATMLGQNPQQLKWKGSHIGVTWSPDARYLVTATQESELHGWQVADGRNMAMRGYATKVRSMAWLSKPPILATAGAECVIAWPFSGSGPQGKPPIEVAKGLGSLVTQVAVHPARPLVAAGFDNGCVAIGDLKPAPESRTVRLRAAGDGKISALTWSPDGTLLVAATETGALSIYDLTSGAA